MVVLEGLENWQYSHSTSVTPVTEETKVDQLCRKKSQRGNEGEGPGSKMVILQILRQGTLLHEQSPGAQGPLSYHHIQWIPLDFQRKETVIQS